MSIESPCILICSMNDATGFCHGCGRTREEIASWMTYSFDERRAVMAALPARLANQERPDRRLTRRAEIARRNLGRSE